MACYFFDTSAIVKYYVKEPGSEWIMEIVDRNDLRTGERVNTVFIAEVSIAETAAAFAILHRTDRISRRTRDNIFDNFLSEAESILKLVPVVSDDFHTAARLTQRYPLKAYDAVQLALALRHHQALARRKLELTFVSGDRQQLEAAEAEGLATGNPFDHLTPSDSSTP